MKVMPEWMRKWAKSDIRNGIAVLFVVGCLSFLFVIVVHAVPEQNKDLINILGGNIIAGLGLILGYYYGSSKTDTDKNKEDDSNS